ncbi:MAG: hypothetical protein PVF47_03190 [Anaerolineae bacterium]|jgi:hypothetical protein
MSEIALSPGIPWNLILDILVSILVWGTVIAGLVLIVDDRIEEDDFHTQSFFQPLSAHKVEESQYGTSSDKQRFLNAGCPANNIKLLDNFWKGANT